MTVGRDFKMFQLRHPFTAVVSGSTGSGKTSFVFRLIDHSKRLMSVAPVKIVYFYGAWQPTFDRYRDTVEFRRGLPPPKFFDGNQQPTLCIIDDLMSEASENGGHGVNQLFTRGSHHNNISVIFLTQNIFDKSLRLMTLNSHYLILLKNCRDVSQVGVLARQMFASKYKFCEEAYFDATRQPFSYICFDLHPTTADHLRVRTGIFPDEKQTVYVHAKSYEPDLYKPEQPVKIRKSVVDASKVDMSARLTRNLPALRALKRMTVQKRKQYLKCCNGDVVDCLSELSSNMLKGRVYMTPPQLECMRRHKRVLRNLATKKLSQRKRRQLVVQNGGFLSALIGPAIGLAASLASSYFGGEGSN